MLEFDRLVEIIARLRGENGCDWDRKQTMDSMKKYILEEIYELFEAIENRNHAEIEEELGDILMHMVFLARIAEEKKRFSIAGVLETINKKLIERHPHVFSDTKVNGVDDILKNWETLKQEQKKHERKFLLDGIPKALPAISRSIKIQEKLSRAGFDWGDTAGVISKLEEELEEMRHEINENQKEKFAGELGDVLFVLVNLGLKMETDPETALQSTNSKVIERCNYIEAALQKSGKNLSGTSLDELNRLWDEAKNIHNR